ncbi:MAG TPA: molybdopterin-dependent oxidoreductase [Polyangiaceae bacterium]|nr:molybdopterin-dependent oxidoreductase [Polyangiaceae bacterium]
MSTTHENPKIRTVRTMCPMNCHPTHCGMRVELEGDRVVGIHGDPENPDSRGFLCVRGQACAEIIGNPARLTQPRLRRGFAASELYQRLLGSEATPPTRESPGSIEADTALPESPDADSGWCTIDWERALELIARTIESAGRSRSAILTGHGVRTPLVARFAHLLQTQYFNPSILCWGLGGFGFHLTGVTEVHSAEDLAAHAELVVLWGSNITSQPTTRRALAAAKRRGAKLFVIDVRYSESCTLADEVFLVRPGTDTALALAIARILIDDQLYDHAFVSAHTFGFEEFAQSLRELDLEQSIALTGIAPERVRALAHAYGSSRRAMILAGGSSMHKTGNGWHAARAIACLPALTGSLSQPGAGMGPRHAAQCHGMGMAKWVPPDPRPPESVIPDEMSRILEALESGAVRVLLLLGTNMLSSFADAGRLEKALRRLDLVVSFDLFENDTSRACAHLSLPGTAWLEELGFKATNTHLYLMDHFLEPPPGVRSAAWLLRQLADRLGCKDFFPWSTMEQALDALFDHDATGHTTVARLRANDARQKLNVNPVAHPEREYSTPSKKVEFVSQRAVELGLPALPTLPPNTENSPTSALASRYPLVLTQGRTLTHFHSFYDHGRALPKLARADPEPRLWLNPQDAVERHIGDDAWLRVYNDRGELRTRARVTNQVPRGVVYMRDGWLGLNHLTSSARSVPDAAARAFPAGSAAYEARVEVEALPFEETAPPQPTNAAAKEPARAELSTTDG